MKSAVITGASAGKVRCQIAPDPMRHLIMSVLPKRTVAKRLGLLPPA